jgi:integrase
MAGQIIRRGDRVWCVRTYLGTDESGKRRYQNKTIQGNKRDAELALAEMLRTRSLGPSILKNEAVLVGELLDDLTNDYKANGQHMPTCNYRVAHLRKAFGNMRASRVDSKAIAAYIADRTADGVAVGTINREIAFLRRAFTIGYQSEPRKVDRVPRIKLFRENNTRTGFFEHEHYTAMLKVLPDSLKGVLVMGYWTGLRKGEIVSLKWQQVDLKNGVLRLEAGTTKSGEARIVPLAPDLWECLKMQREKTNLEHPQCEHVFHLEGKPFHDFRPEWKAASKEAGLVDENGKPKLLFHDLRRSAVRNLLRGGAPEKVAMAISGHKTRAVFDRYHIISESDLRTAITRLSGYISQQESEAAAGPEKSAIGTQETNPHTIRTQEGNQRLQ